MTNRELDAACATIAQLRSSIRLYHLTANAEETRILMQDGSEPYNRAKWIDPVDETTTAGVYEARMAEVLQQLIIVRDRCRATQWIDGRDMADLRQWTQCARRTIRAAWEWHMNA